MVVLLAVVALAVAVVQAATGLGFALILSPAVFALLAQTELMTEAEEE